MTRAALCGALLVSVTLGCGRSSTSGNDEISAEERSRLSGYIAFVSERGANKDVWRVWPQNGEEHQFTSGEEDEYPAAFATDGGALLVIATREVDGAHLEQLRLHSTGAQPHKKALHLHAPRARSRNPSFSPDGTFFVFESNEHSFSDVALMILEDEPGTLTYSDADKLAPARRLTFSGKGNFEPALSPYGLRVAFVSSRDGNPEIYVMDLAGKDSEARRLTNSPREDGAPRWSPDGKRILFSSAREPRRMRLYVMNADGSDQRPLSGDADTGDEREPAWNPDGKRVAFVGRKSAKDTRIFVADVSTRSPAKAITGGQRRADQPVWSPYGGHLVYVADDGDNADLYLMREDGTGATRLTTAKGADWLPRWSPTHDVIPYGRVSEAARAAAASAGDPVATRASGYRRSAEELEPQVTPRLQELASQVKGQLVGLEHRFKSESSLARKIKLRMHEKSLPLADVVIDDALRYTIQVEDTPSGHYGESVRDTLAALEKQGHEVVDVKNYWSRGDSYSGINSVLKAPSGLLWELQFHTAKSLETRNQYHPMYSEMRKVDTPLARKRELFDAMTAPWRDIPIPKDVLREKSLHERERIIKYPPPGAKPAQP